MFTVSFRAGRLRLTVFLVALALVFILILIFQSADKEQTASAPPPAAQNGSTVEQHRAFLAGFGWKIEGDLPQEISVVTIPQTFNAVYERYNALQLAGGYDLRPYRGMQVTKYVYPVADYPGEAPGTVQATLLVYRGGVIGGDICSVRLDGFMHGFERRNTENETDQTR